MPPDDFGYIRQLALSALNQGKTEQAVGYCRRLTVLRPRDPDGHFLLGMAEDARNNTKDAVAAVESALSFEETAEYLAHYGRLLSRFKKMDMAAQAADRALALNPKDPLTLDTIGCVFSRLGQHNRAIPIFEQAVNGQPNNPQFRFNLATSHQFTGDFEAAEQDYELIIDHTPSFVKAHTALSTLRRQTSERNHIARLEGLLTKVRDPAAALHIRYALAKECEDVGRDYDAFQHLHAANTKRKASLKYDFKQDSALFRAVMSAFTSPLPVTEHQPTSDSTPIFILGMPRTGTTLVDRIVSSHPDVVSAGELQTLPLLIKQMSGSTTPVVLDETALSTASNIDRVDLGRRYIAESAALRKGGPYFTDKLPLNFFNVGFVVEALPSARIICLRRSPMDTVWSNYKNLFATDFSYYNYSYDVRDTAEYIVLFNALMDHWDSVYPRHVHHLSYEDLVSDFEAQVCRLIDHCELDWSDKCLHFHENEAAVATPSAVQVREPIYTGSVGKWRRFEAHLGDAVAVFEREGLAL